MVRSRFSHLIRLDAAVTQSLAWRSLFCEARSLLIEIWKRHKRFNNGSISYSYREAKKALGIGSTKVKKALNQLIDRGFLIIRRASSFNFKGNGGASKVTEWELTTENCDGENPKRNYRTYQN